MSESNDLPRLGIVFEPISTPPMRISGACAGRWHTLWIVDRAIDSFDASAARLLPRLGTVVDITGMSAAEAAREVARQAPDGMLALAESELLRTAQLAAEIGLKFHSPETVGRLTSKVAQRAALAAAGLPTPGYCPVPRAASATDRERILDLVRLPAVLKPQAGSSSRNTYLISTPDELRYALSQVQVPSRDVSDDFILEEALADSWSRGSRPYADYASIETVVVDGRCHHVATTGRTPLAEPFRETGFFTPSNLADGVLRCLEDLTENAIAAMSPGAPLTGAFHTEIKLTPDGPRVIEVNGRPGGIWIPEIVEMVGGPPILTLAGLAALDLPLDLPETSVTQGVGYELQVQAPVGTARLLSIDGLQEIAHLDGVRTVTLSKQAGATVDWREGTTGSLFTVVGVSKDHNALWDLRSLIEKTVKVTFEPSR